MARIAHLIAVSSALAALGTFTGCSSDADTPSDDANITAESGDGGDTDGAASRDAAACPKGRGCGDGCCAGSEICSFQKCVAPGAACVDSSDCPPGGYCEYAALGAGSGDAGAAPSSVDAAAACSGGAVQKSGVCLPRPPVCAANAPASSSGGISCLDKCEYKTTAAFKPVLKFAWGGKITAPFATDVMMTPIVIELDDDNCDGKVSEADIPEIVFTSFTGGDYRSKGTLHAISIVGGVVVNKWEKPGAVSPGGQLAGGDIDGKPGNEVVACGNDGLVHAYNGDGSLLWKTPTAVACRMPSLADLDGDGKVEVIVEGGILVGATGATKAAFSEPLAGTFVVSDLDGDGKLDVITGGQAFDANGQLFVSTGTKGFSAVGDFDKDGKPEVVVIETNKHSASFWRYDATAPGKFAWVRQGVDINGKLPQHCPGLTIGGGPPTVADFDGDGVPDVAVAGGIGYMVLNGAKVVNPAVANAATVLWAAQTQDCSSASTGSSVFDFDGDGKAEVVYSDERHLRIYEGPTGKVLFETCNTTGTLIEYPVVADVDNDGHADIVVVSNSYANFTADQQCNDGKGISQAGVRVFGDVAGNWVRTRRVWNEHAYHVTNVNEDGTIPAHEASNWKQPGLNNFRQNKQPGSEFAAPDAVVSVGSECTGTFGLVATVTNIGEAPLPAGVAVGFYSGAAGSGSLLGKASTTHALYAAQSEKVTLPLAAPPPGVQDGSVKVYAIVDDSMTPHTPWHECRTDNNTSPAASAACSAVK